MKIKTTKEILQNFLQHLTEYIAYEKIRPWSKDEIKELLVITCLEDLREKIINQLFRIRNEDLNKKTSVTITHTQRVVLSCIFNRYQVKPVLLQLEFQILNNLTIKKNG